MPKITIKMPATKKVVKVTRKKKGKTKVKT